MANKHFFEPLLPGFHSHLDIPVAFFLKYIERRDEQMTAELRSDASKIIWKVKLDGQRFTDGWKEFAFAHDLRIGDIVIFRQERHLAFHVTLFGPSSCQIQYGSSLEEESNLEKKKKVKKSSNGETESSSLDPSCFMANVVPSSLRYDLMEFPSSFVRANGLVTGSGDIVLMNEKGRSWTLKMKQKLSRGRIYVKGGWRSFCDANGLRIGDTFTFKLIQRAGTRVLRLLPKEPEEEKEECTEANKVESLLKDQESDEESSHDEKITQECSTRKEKKRRLMGKGSSSPSVNRFVTLTLTPYSISSSVLRLPIPFTRMNGINEETKLTLLDKHNVKWSTRLYLEDRKRNRVRMVGGWKQFFQANCVTTNESIMLELIWEEDTSCVLKFHSKVNL